MNRTEEAGELKGMSHEAQSWPTLRYATFAILAETTLPNYATLYLHCYVTVPITDFFRNAARNISYCHTCEIQS